MTGFDILKIYDREIDQAYTDFESTSQKSSRMNVAIINIIERIFRGLDSQKDYDDIRSLIVYEKNFPLFDGALLINPFLIESVVVTPPVVPPGFTSIELNFTQPHTLSSADLPHLVFGNIENSGLSQEAFVGPFAITSPTQIVFQTQSSINGSYVENSVSVYSSISVAGNYMHLLSVRPKYKQPLSKLRVKVEGVEANKIKFLYPTVFRTGHVVKITTSPILQSYEQDYYVQSLSKRTIALFQDKELSIPASLSTIPVGTSYVFNLVFSESAEKQSPHEFVNRYLGVDPWAPSYILSDGKIYFRPETPSPSSASMTYIRSDITFFDLESNSVDYEVYYSRKFIQRVIDEAVADFNRSVRDYNALNSENGQILINP